jgi:hypothetical protein
MFRIEWRISDIGYLILDSNWIGIGDSASNIRHLPVIGTAAWPAGPRPIVPAEYSR